MNPILAIGQILLSIALMAAILLQARGTGLSGTFGGDSAVYRSRRGVERRLWQFTIVLLVLFILFALVAFATAARWPDRPARGPTAGRLHVAEPTRPRGRGPADPGPDPARRVAGHSAGEPPCSAVPDASPETTPPPPVVYREAVVGAPESITPVTARSRSERTLVGLIFSGLVRLGPDDTLEPDLASSWTVDADGRTWTFRIRDDATWQDGVPVTAADVVYTIEALKNPDASGATAASWAEVTAEAIDDKTVTLSLDTPVSGFVAAATQPLLPAHLLAGIPFADLATSDVCPAAGGYRAIRPVRAGRPACRADRGGVAGCRAAARRGRDRIALDRFAGHARAHGRRTCGRFRICSRSSWTSTPTTRQLPTPSAPARWMPCRGWALRRWRHSRALPASSGSATRRPRCPPSC